MTMVYTYSMKTLKPTKYLKQILHAGQKDIKAGKVSPSFKTAKEAIAWLKDSSARYADGSLA